MSEFLLLAQFLLLIAGWFLYLRAQRELRDVVRTHSWSAQSDQLRHTVEELLSKLLGEAERAKRELDARIRLLGTVPEPTAGSPTAAAVYALAEAGHLPAEIARRLSKPIGEVEFVLDVGRESDRVASGVVRGASEEES